MGQFTVHQLKVGYKFNLKAGNGQIIASSGVYREMDDCLRAIECVRRCVDAPVEDQTVVGYLPIPFPKFEMRQNEYGAVSFYLWGDDGKLLIRGKGYTAKRSCLAGIRSLLQNAPGAVVLTG